MKLVDNRRGRKIIIIIILFFHDLIFHFIGIRERKVCESQLIYGKFHCGARKIASHKLWTPWTVLSSPASASSGHTFTAGVIERKSFGTKLKNRRTCARARIESIASSTTWNEYTLTSIWTSYCRTWCYLARWGTFGILFFFCCWNVLDKQCLFECSVSSIGTVDDSYALEMKFVTYPLTTSVGSKITSSSSHVKVQIILTITRHWCFVRASTDKESKYP